MKQKGNLQNCIIADESIKSTNQLLYDYYTDISAAKLKAYALIQLAFLLLTNTALGKSLKLYIIENINELNS